MARILIVDNETSILGVLSKLLSAEGYECETARNGQEAKGLVEANAFDLMISDIRMSPMDGMKLLRSARSLRPEMAVIMMTAFGTVETAIEAMKLGAFDYVTKPFKVEELLLAIRRALDYQQAVVENRSLKTQLQTRYRFENIVAESPSMKRVCEVIERVAPTDTTILIYGESGTGKEVVAKAIHAYSGRKDGKFLAVNCAALPEALLESEMFGHVKGAFTGASSDKRGLFEAADGGTLLLDEIGSMPLSIQGKLLRVLQERELRRVGGNQTIQIDVRVLAATNTPLEDLIRDGAFREDLYYRLSIIPVTIEPLARRTEDIMPLVFHVIRTELGEGVAPPDIDPAVPPILEQYAWPGNVRELENAVKHALTFTRENRITKDVLPKKIIGAAAGEEPSAEISIGTADFQSFDSLKDFLRATEREYLEHVLNVVGGDKEKAAGALDISLATLYRKLASPQKADV